MAISIAERCPFSMCFASLPFRPGACAALQCAVTTTPITPGRYVELPFRMLRLHLAAPPSPRQIRTAILGGACATSALRRTPLVGNRVAAGIEPGAVRSSQRFSLGSSVRMT